MALQISSPMVRSSTLLLFFEISVHRSPAFRIVPISLLEPGESCRWQGHCQSVGLVRGVEKGEMGDVEGSLPFVVFRRRSI